MGGGVLFSHGCHYIDLIQWYLGIPRRVTLSTSGRGTEWLEGEGTAAALLAFDEDIAATYICSWGMRHRFPDEYWKSGMYVYCSDALLVTDYETVELITGNRREVVLRTHEPDVTPYLGWNTEGEIGHFLDCIKD